MERPLTVAGLIEKRRELVARLKLAKAEIKTLTHGIDALDQVLKLFAPEINGADAKLMRLPIPHAASKGEMQRAALDLLRETGQPITSRMVAARFCETRDLHLDDAAFKTVRDRASNAMCHLRDKGLVCQVGKKGADVQWMLADSRD
jgi:hypothetical protein